VSARLRSGVVYQIYPRSFQDSNGDGIGDLPGITSRLDHLAALGVDAVWLSPIYPSPLADGGYDVSDLMAVDPRLGTLTDVEQLAAATHERGVALLLDLVPNHTSIEHPWFRDHPDRYVWADQPANNWRAAFGGPAWSRDETTGRYYLHSFYPEQPDLDWRNPAVPAAMQDAVRFWLGRGVDGFRIDAVDRLAKHPQLLDDGPAEERFPFRLPAELAELDRRHSSNWPPAIAPPLQALRQAAGDAYLVGEVYRPTADLAPYLEFFDSAFVFELLFADWRADSVGAVIERGARLPGAAWMLSNHDFSRIGSRIGERFQRVAAMLLLTLPGAAFVYQGDEIGLMDGTGGGTGPPFDRFGRDGARHPMQWEAGPAGGFTTGTPWLSAVDPERRNVAAQAGGPGSLLELYRSLIRLRRSLAGPLDVLCADPGGPLVYRRGEHTVALNLGDEPRPFDVRGSVVCATHPDGPPGRLAPGAGLVAHG
jgi:alpha-glucosidase